MKDSSNLGHKEKNRESYHGGYVYNLFGGCDVMIETRRAFSILKTAIYRNSMWCLSGTCTFNQGVYKICNVSFVIYMCNVFYDWY